MKSISNMNRVFGDKKKQKQKQNKKQQIKRAVELGNALRAVGLVGFKQNDNSRATIVSYTPRDKRF